MTPQEWFDRFYSLENEALLTIIENVGFGEVKIIVHEQKPVKLFPTPEIRLSDKLKMKDMLRKQKYLKG